MAVQVNTSPVKSQAEVRTVRIFTDEHGRQWSAAVNNLGIHAGYPVSPLTPKFKAPLYPPPKYLEITDIAAGTLRTNTNAWLAELELRHGEYETLKQQQASAMYGDGAPDAIERGDKALFFRIGPPPRPIEQVLAYRQGHPWVLGKDPEKPKDLAPYFPERRQRARRTFLTAAEERLQEAQKPADEAGHDEESAKDGMAKRYLAGESGTKIAAAYGVSASTVYQALEERGVERRPSAVKKAS